MQTWEYALLLLISLAGGAAAFFFKSVPRAKLKDVLAFSGAYILGITVLHLLGDVYGSGLASPGRWILAGFFVQLLLDFLSKGIEHGHVHAAAGPGRGFLAQVMLGLCLHAFFEGLPLGGHGAFHEVGGAGHAHGGGAGSLLIGIVLHEAPASFTLASLLLLSNFEKRTVWLCLLAKSLMAPAGAMAAALWRPDAATVAALTGVVIGLFLHIATTILFEADSSSHHRMGWARLLAVAGGTVLAWLTAG